MFPGGVRAVDGVDLELRPGEIHALVGENGAGKTTLASIAAGTLPPTAGTIQAQGSVGLVHQHFELVDRLRVWENVVLGIEPRRGLRIGETAARELVRELSQRNGLEVEPDAVVETLPVGIAQRVELLRALARDPAVLILDEPTAVLAPAEIDGLFATIRALASRGTAILIITHKLQEVIAHTHRVTVMRAGKVVADTLALAQESIRPGVTTAEPDRIAEQYIRSQGGEPTFLGYRGYPASLCASPNALVVHGIPGAYALEEGELPLILLFSGTVFFRDQEGSLQIAQIPWEKEASFRLPVSAWKDLMSFYYPNAAWLYLHKDVFDRLLDYKTRNGIPTWEAAMERLLSEASAQVRP